MKDKKPGSLRTTKTRLRTAKGRKISSTLWLERQLNDPYVQRAKAEGYRSRAAYKLIELDEKCRFLKGGLRVVDLGAAPGGWAQVAAKKKAKVIGIDLLPIQSIPGAELIEMDFMDDAAPGVLKQMLGGKADVVLSDMAPNSSGHSDTDHLRIMALVEAAFMFACEVLDEGGVFVAKVWQGGTEGDMLKEMKRRFDTVRHVKPGASRANSAEIYVVAMGFRSE